ncbi:MAG: TolC family protein, partial [Candidatus Eremiobacteraeota bacterium]|nr:TolC family protein [Candidatus Eremiobacteraeota bacterium]
MKRILPWLLLILLVMPVWAQTEPAAEPAAVPETVPAEPASPEPAPAGPVLQLDLQEALKRALANSPTLEEYRSKVRQANYKIDEAYTPAYPTADFSATYSHVEPPVSLPGGVVISPTDNYQFNLTLKQAIFTFGRLRWSTLASELSELSARENYRNEIDKLIQDVAVRYIQAQLAADQVAITEDTLASQEANLKQSELLFEQGVAARFDVLRNRSAVSQARQSVLSARNDAKLAKARLLSAMGLSLDQEVELAPTPATEPPPFDLEQSRAKALEDRPELGALNWAIKASEAQVRATWAQDNPRIDLQNSTVNRNVTGFSPGTQNTTSIVLSIPLFDGGLTRARAQQAEEAVTQLRQNLEQTQRVVLLDVEDSYRSVQTAYQAIKVAEQQVEESEEALRVAQLRYKNGVSTNVELLDAQAALSQARFAMAQARANYQVANWRWWKATSGEYPVDVPLTDEYRAPDP